MCFAYIYDVILFKPNWHIPPPWFLWSCKILPSSIPLFSFSLMDIEAAGKKTQQRKIFIFWYKKTLEIGTHGEHVKTALEFDD